jgi:hypothetical protein
VNSIPSEVIKWVENIYRKMDFIKHLHKLTTRSDIKLERFAIFNKYEKIKVSLIFLLNAKHRFFNIVHC